MKKLKDILGIQEKTAADLVNKDQILDPATKRMLDGHEVTEFQPKENAPEADDKLFKATNITRAKYKGVKEEETDIDEGNAANKAKKNDVVNSVGKKLLKGAEHEYTVDKDLNSKLQGAFSKHYGRGVLKNWKPERFKQLACKEETDEELMAEAVKLVEAFGQLFSANKDEVRDPDYHSSMYRTFADQAREHKIHAFGHKSFLEDKNIPRKEKKFHEAAADAHLQLHDAYSGMASHHLEKLNLAHSKAMKKDKA